MLYSCFDCSTVQAAGAAGAGGGAGETAGCVAADVSVLAVSVCELAMRRSIGWLRIQKLYAPAVAVADEQLSLVQAARLSLPELDGVGSQSEPRPKGRPRYRRALELLLEFGDARVEIRHTRHRTALTRRPRADLAAA